MAELADAADSKSAEVHPSWGFDPPSRHQRINDLQLIVVDAPADLLHITAHSLFLASNQLIELSLNLVQLDEVHHEKEDEERPTAFRVVFQVASSPRRRRFELP